MTCELRCDHQNHIVLLVERGPRFTKYIKRDGKVIDVHKTPHPEFDKAYRFLYTDYPLANYASKMLKQTDLGIVVTHRARLVLDQLTKEPIMGKIAAPVTTAPAPPVKSAKTAPVAEKPAKTPVAKTAPEEGAEKAPRNRREKIEGDKRIKVLKENPARQGTMRHAIVDTIFAAKTVREACESSVERPTKEGKEPSDYKIGLPDIYFCLENELIELY